jgi:hypothetical protein
MELVKEEAMAVAMAMMDAEHQIASYLLNLEEQQTVVEDVPEDEDNVPIYMFLANQNIILNIYAYRNRNGSRSRGRNRGRNRSRSRSTASYGHQRWKSSILFSEI